MTRWVSGFASTLALAFLLVERRCWLFFFGSFTGGGVAAGGSTGLGAAGLTGWAQPQAPCPSG